MVREELRPTNEMMVQSAFGRAWHGKGSRPEWRGFGVVQGTFGSRSVPFGSGADEPLVCR